MFAFVKNAWFVRVSALTVLITVVESARRSLDFLALASHESQIVAAFVLGVLIAPVIYWVLDKVFFLSKHYYMLHILRKCINEYVASKEIDRNKRYILRTALWKIGFQTPDPSEKDDIWEKYIDLMRINADRGRLGTAKEISDKMRKVVEI